jgi:hypothetical protein
MTSVKYKVTRTVVSQVNGLSLLERGQLGGHGLKVVDVDSYQESGAAFLLQADDGNLAGPGRFLRPIPGPEHGVLDPEFRFDV